MKAYIIYPTTPSNNQHVRGYASFKRLCKEENLDSNVLKKEHLPARIPGGEIIVEITIDDRL